MANEASTAVAFVDDVLGQCTKGRFQSIRFFAVLDRASKDQTRALLEAHSRSQNMLEVVWAPENRGVVDAYVAGYRAALAAGCDWILEIDAGYSHDPADIPRFLDLVPGRVDCVFGSRLCPGAKMSDVPFKRRIISSGGTWLAKRLLGSKLTDMTSGFQFFSRHALEHVLSRGIKSRGPFFQTEMKAYCQRFSVVEVPIRYRAPSHHVKVGAILDSFQNLWRLCRIRMSGQL